MAKKKAAATKLKVEAAPTKKKRGLAASRARRRARGLGVTPVRAARSNPTANPPVASDLINVILPGFGAYAGTRTFARLVYSVVQRRWPKWGKHAYVAAGLATFGSAWFLAHRFEKLAKYHDPVLLGSGVAALQGAAQTYLPKKYRWLLGDPRPEDVVTPARALPPAAPRPAADEDDGLDAIAEATGSSEHRAFERQLRNLERRAAKPKHATVRAQAAPAAAAEEDDDEPVILDDGADDDGDLNTGVFAASN